MECQLSKVSEATGWKFQEYISIAEVIYIILWFDGIPVLLASLFNSLREIFSKDFICEGICLRTFLFYH